MPGYPPLVYNKSSRGDARYDVRGLPTNEHGNRVDSYGNEYDANGLFIGGPKPPPTFMEGLRGSDEMNGDQWGDYLGPRRGAPPPQPAAPAQPKYDLSNDVVEMPARNPNKPLDSQNPNAVRYALMRLAQLRSLGYEFDIIDGDPTATWRNASLGVADEARRLGFENPRDWLAGRKPTRAMPAGFYDEGDTVAPPASTPRRTRPSAAGAKKLHSRPKPSAAGAKKVVKRPRPSASGAKKVAKRPAARRGPRGAS